MVAEEGRVRSRGARGGGGGGIAEEDGASGTIFPEGVEARLRGRGCTDTQEILHLETSPLTLALLMSAGDEAVGAQECGRMGILIVVIIMALTLPLFVVPLFYMESAFPS